MGGGFGGGGMGMGGGFGGLDVLGAGVNGVKKILGRNVLYLMVVNMPTEEEMVSAAPMTRQTEKGEATATPLMSREAEAPVGLPPGYED